jgi:hypothetical protein
MAMAHGRPTKQALMKKRNLLHGNDSDAIYTNGSVEIGRATIKWEHMEPDTQVS